MRNREPAPHVFVPGIVGTSSKSESGQGIARQRRCFWGLCGGSLLKGTVGVADDIVREALTESNETPGSLDRGPSFQTLCGFPGFTKLEKVAYVSKAFRESFLLWVTIPSRSDGGYEIQVDRDD